MGFRYRTRLIERVRRWMLPRITVCIPTRGRPLAFASTVMALWRLRNSNNLDFVAGIDDDDAPSLEIVERLKKEVPITASVGPRSTLSAVNNRCSKVAASDDCDILVCATDRTIPITYEWDAAIRYSNDQHPQRVLWWSCPHSGMTDLPIIPWRFLAALDGEWASGIFPFWFDDLWLAEIDMMIFGDQPIKTPATYAGHRGVTQNARDLLFWWNVFIKTRHMRWSIAADVGERIDACPENLKEPKWLERDSEAIRNAKDVEKKFADKSAPSAAYIEAKKRAMELICA